MHRKELRQFRFPAENAHAARRQFQRQCSHNGTAPVHHVLQIAHLAHEVGRKNLALSLGVHDFVGNAGAAGRVLFQFQTQMPGTRLELREIGFYHVHIRAMQHAVGVVILERLEVRVASQREKHEPFAVFLVEAGGIPLAAIGQHLPLAVAGQFREMRPRIAFTDHIRKGPNRMHGFDVADIVKHLPGARRAFAGTPRFEDGIQPCQPVADIAVVAVRNDDGTAILQILADARKIRRILFRQNLRAALPLHPEVEQRHHHCHIIIAARVGESRQPFFRTGKMPGIPAQRLNRVLIFEIMPGFTIENGDFLTHGRNRKNASAKSCASPLSAPR